MEVANEECSSCSGGSSESSGGSTVSSPEESEEEETANQPGTAFSSSLTLIRTNGQMYKYPDGKAGMGQSQKQHSMTVYGADQLQEFECIGFKI